MKVYKVGSKDDPYNGRMKMTKQTTTSRVLKRTCVELSTRGRVRNQLSVQVPLNQRKQPRITSVLHTRVSISLFTSNRNSYNRNVKIRSAIAIKVHCVVQKPLVSTRPVGTGVRARAPNSSLILNFPNWEFPFRRCMFIHAQCLELTTFFRFSHPTQPGP